MCYTVSRDTVIRHAFLSCDICCSYTICDVVIWYVILQCDICCSYTICDVVIWYVILQCDICPGHTICDVVICYVILTCLILFFSHMDSHNLWNKTKFPAACFKIIMYSVQVWLVIHYPVYVCTEVTVFLIKFL